MYNNIQLGFSESNYKQWESITYTLEILVLFLCLYYKQNDTFFVEILVLCIEFVHQSAFGMQCFVLHIKVLVNSLTAETEYKFLKNLVLHLCANRTKSALTHSVLWAKTICLQVLWNIICIFVSFVHKIFGSTKIYIYINTGFRWYLYADYEHSV